MQTSFEFLDSPLFPATCDVANGKFLPLIHPKEATGVTVSCNNPLRQNIVTCKDHHKDEFIQEVSGLALNTKLSSAIEELPSYIPVLDYSCRNVIIPELFPTIGIGIWDILSRGVKFKAGQYHTQDNIRIRHNILSSKAFSNKSTILFLTGHDTIIEWLWYNRDECKFFETISKMGFTAISSFDFSVIGNECPFSQLLNQKKSLHSSFLIEQTGSITLPNIYAITQYHIERWSHWLMQNPSVKFFMINCQLQKRDIDINKILAAVTSFLASFPYLHVLLQGFPINRIDQFGSYLERVHFADKTAIKKAQSNIQLIFDESLNIFVEKSRMELKIEELAVNNIMARNAYIKSKKVKS